LKISDSFCISNIPFSRDRIEYFDPIILLYFSIKLPFLVLFAFNFMSGKALNDTVPYLDIGVFCPEDVNRDGIIKYTGSGNDRDPILVAVGGSTPNNSVPCSCCPEDVTGDGFVKYTGSGNDRDPILVAVGGSTPNNTVSCVGQNGMMSNSETTVTIPPIGTIRVVVDKHGPRKYFINE